MRDLGYGVIFICTWLWGTKWPTVYADRLFAGIKRNLRQEYRSVLITDQPVNCADIVCQIDEIDRPLLDRRGCLVRMRMFDHVWQERLGMKAGSRIVNIDVDAIITGELDPLFGGDDEFRIMQGFNSTNPCPFNGSLWMFRAGERHDVFDDFSFEEYKRLDVPFHAIPDDQGWLHSRFPNAASYTPADGVYAFKKKTWPGGLELPGGARVIAFPGRTPEQ